MLHRGTYALTSDATASVALKPKTSNWIAALIGVDGNFTRGDKAIAFHSLRLQHGVSGHLSRRHGVEFDRPVASIGLVDVLAHRGRGPAGLFRRGHGNLVHLGWFAGHARTLYLARCGTGQYPR